MRFASTLIRIGTWFVASATPLFGQDIEEKVRDSLLSVNAPREHRLEFLINSELQYNFRNKVNWVNLFTLRGGISSEALGWWDGGSLEFTTISIYRTSSERIADDLMTFSNIDTEQLPISLFVLGYHQRFRNGRIFFGLRNLNQDYFIAPYSALFTNSSCGIYPTLSVNFPCPNYPLSAMGIVAEYFFTRSFLICNSLYNGVAYNPYRDGWKLFAINPKRDGVFNATELAYHLKGSYDGHYYLGGAFHTPYTDTDGELRPFNYALWGVIEQDFFNRNNRQIGMLLQGSWAPRRMNSCYGYVGAGIIFSGFVSGSRPNQDHFSLVANYGAFDASRETCIEATWNYELLPHLRIQPTFQLILTGQEKTAIGLLRVNYCLDLLGAMRKKGRRSEPYKA